MSMQIYLVGGAVRDELLGLEVKEKDWVVVGSCVDEMLKQGFKQVGKDFPVFLHPKTHEEYALARTERKVAKGYHGFTVHAEKHVTLEEDLKRRDLTINAIAQDSSGKYIDPYHGMADIQHKLLRHISAAFSEDPLRILRLARFSARFSDFNVDPETMSLCKHMVASGEVDALVAERMWKEIERALSTPAPWRFFEVLQQTGALAVVMPEITWNEQQKQSLHNCADISENAAIRWACLLHQLSSDEIKALNKRLNTPQRFQQLSLLCGKHHTEVKNILEKDAATVLKLLLTCDALRRKDRFDNLLTAISSCNANKTNPQLDFLKQAEEKIRTLNLQPLLKKGSLKGQQLAEAIFKERQQAIAGIIEKRKRT